MVQTITRRNNTFEKYVANCVPIWTSAPPPPYICLLQLSSAIIVVFLVNESCECHCQVTDYTDSVSAHVLIRGVLKSSWVVGAFEGHSPIWGQFVSNYDAYVRRIIRCYIARVIRLQEYLTPGKNKSEFKNPTSGIKTKKYHLLDVFLLCASFLYTKMICCSTFVMFFLPQL